ncbi:hypothetical protein [Sodalis endosymbiont of Henestaris halophilus]|uniref:hypothetical protein n=1 Tax=Sodalis endosymbiont of Henestaris halophilus TaxID=1929246 RepID=UPI0012FDDE55|nr:hypothetical protein [Sodalis endosymbiont of Henestaris halophilus]
MALLSYYDIIFYQIICKLMSKLDKIVVNYLIVKCNNKPCFFFVSNTKALFCTLNKCCP